ncbi:MULTISPECIES: anti-sigma F factor [Clostridium]|uniref:Anti-sigma F factor n=5 Tax=Clostridium TaxID=1485 RepID=A0A168MI04_9CLOT|nr:MULTISPECIES: anti-sigma F factor [Clostridium]ADK16441.1 predicted anti-sigma factor F [Clostridium ljungdahlii DSM 13528]AGY75519.1 anti-sigma F factor [Clostridium autoethanogenum DSM 10061]ALU35685.1 Anti-sigma F factor [Clostridium autoethanogenum DSM 10061]OAA84719.1 Anti-sigma F factor [Clostridium ljungdahlii]OAA89683.1 Anti-sigma F factor [Clostridium ljungdahlii DSM 13528]
MYDNSMKIEFISKSQNESFARVSVAAFVSQLDPTVEELADVKTAVSEAVTNSIIHGYENKEGVVKIQAFIKEKELTLIVEDQGVGIENIELARQPLYTSRPDLERSGMGFTVMETFMDSLKVESEKNKGTRLTMKKVFNSLS